MKELFDSASFPAGVDVVHVGIQNDLEHHLGMVAGLRLQPESAYIASGNFEKDSGPQPGRQPCAPDRYLQYSHLFFEEKALFGSSNSFSCLGL